ncbi:unnamed protein product [Pieris macdunnoughi]|uniref:Uncharacterized protein n=1 Tax=Pieris macdunnoughi TaxID=345717 RepID=A0A821RNX9_9NEOP|nr:unnamed protein product [Pieris macdunnoughi]
MTPVSRAFVVRFITNGGYYWRAPMTDESEAARRGRGVPPAPPPRVVRPEPKPRTAPPRLIRPSEHLAMVERAMAERTMVERSIAERSMIERSIAERSMADRSMMERPIPERSTVERGMERRPPVPLNPSVTVLHGPRPPPPPPPAPRHYVPPPRMPAPTSPVMRLPQPPRNPQMLMPFELLPKQGGASDLFDLSDLHQNVAASVFTE